MEDRVIGFIRGVSAGLLPVKFVCLYKRRNRYTISGMGSLTRINASGFV